MKEALKSLTPRPFLQAYGTMRRYMHRLLAPTPADEVVRFNLQSIHAGHFTTTYRGVPTFRCPFDYVMYQMVVSEVQPDLVIEIGSNNGGTALYLADLMNALGKGIVHSIDIEDRIPHIVKNHPRIRLFSAGWQTYDLAFVAEFKTILVIDDGSHLYEEVLGALQKFSPVVTSGSYFIVEDGILNELGLEEQYHGGPLRAIREFLPNNPQFVVDRSYCDRYGKNATYNVNGYLKKI